jgi:hypothetical protein
LDAVHYAKLATPRAELKCEIRVSYKIVGSDEILHYSVGSSSNTSPDAMFHYLASEIQGFIPLTFNMEITD